MRKYALTFCIALGIIFFPNAIYAKNIEVPFSAQAPFALWGIEPWENACEETTILMVDAFYSQNTLDKYKAKDGILHIVNIKEELFGNSLDENAQKIVSIINGTLSWSAKIVHSPTLPQIKAEIDAGRPIILPTNGKELQNSNFINGGPPYHTVVISGYDDQKKVFYTQEPGTRHGKNFVYSYTTLMNAMHDFLPNNTQNGAKLAIFTNPIDTNGHTDIDNDGLSKQQELKIGTKPWKSDTDEDGYSDGLEVESGYNPLTNEKNITNGNLIKSKNNPNIFLLLQGKKQKIANEQVFIKHNWQWNEIIIVTDKYINNIPSGGIIL